MQLMEKFLENLLEAEKILKTTDRMIYVTFPLIKDKRILLKAIQEIKVAAIDCIKSILQYDYIFKRINLKKDPIENFRTFAEKCAPRYGITSSELKEIAELFDFVDKHNESPLEFIKNEKVIILSGNMQPKTLTLEKTKEFLFVIKEILKKARTVISRSF